MIDWIRRSMLLYNSYTTKKFMSSPHGLARAEHIPSIHLAKCVDGTSNALQNMSDHQKMTGTYSVVDTR